MNLANWITDHLSAILTTLFGGAGAQLIMKAWTRRADLRQTNTAADLNLASANEKLIAQLMGDGESLRKRVQELEIKVEQVTKNAAEQLATAHSENTRLSQLAARLQVDLDIANGQLAQLRPRYPYAGGI